MTRNSPLKNDYQSYEGQTNINKILNKKANNIDILPNTQAVFQSYSNNP